MIRRVLAVVVVALVLCAVVGDRLAASAAQRAVAIKARDAALLRTNPRVKITGFPFLTQAARGKYDKITVTTHDIHRGGLRLDTVAATFYGVHVGLGSALAGKVRSVPIDRSTGHLLVTATDLNAFLAARKVSVNIVGTSLSVSAQPLLGGRRVAVNGNYTVTVSGRDLVFTPVPGSLQSGGVPLPAGSVAAASSALSLRVDTGVLPFGLTLRQVTLTDDGLDVSATATGLVVSVPADASRVSPSS